jgi:hypothetical protein
MEMNEPGLDLHDWETRWQQLVEVAEESPADAAGEMDRLVEEMLGARGFLEAHDEASKQIRGRTRHLAALRTRRGKRR